MTIFIKEVRKAVAMGYNDPEGVVRGDTVRIEGFEDGDWVTKLEDIPNDGEFEVAYPSNFTGESKLRVVGSDSGVEEGSVSIP